MSQPFDNRDYDTATIARLCREIDERLLPRIAALEPLVAELADALECHNLDHLQDDLIQRAREALAE